MCGSMVIVTVPTRVIESFGGFLGSSIMTPLRLCGFVQYFSKRPSLIHFCRERARDSVKTPLCKRKGLVRCHLKQCSLLCSSVRVRRTSLVLIGNLQATGPRAAQSRLSAAVGQLQSTLVRLALVMVKAAEEFPQQRVREEAASGFVDGCCVVWLVALARREQPLGAEAFSSSPWRQSRAGERTTRRGTDSS